MLEYSTTQRTGPRPKFCKKFHSHPIGFEKAGMFCVALPHGRMKKHNKTIPAAAKLNLLRQICNFIPDFLVPKLA
ncbi:MAG TPA: hypothetical protein VKQ08_11360, partial [Cyclobacteriaceae bacterium]|nr:hypothetical protein [Cyclobacteriaceae bacterium]